MVPPFCPAKIEPLFVNPTSADGHRALTLPPSFDPCPQWVKTLYRSITIFYPALALPVTIVVVVGGSWRTEKVGCSGGGG